MRRRPARTHRRRRPQAASVANVPRRDRNEAPRTGVPLLLLSRRAPHDRAESQKATADQDQQTRLRKHRAMVSGGHHRHWQRLRNRNGNGGGRSRLWCNRCRDWQQCQHKKSDRRCHTPHRSHVALPLSLFRPLVGGSVGVGCSSDMPREMPFLSCLFARKTITNARGMPSRDKEVPLPAQAWVGRALNPENAC